MKSDAASGRGPRPRWQKLVAGVGGAALLSTALIGFAHTQAGRPLLALMTGAPGCPAGLDEQDPVRVEAFRIEQLGKHTGSVAAGSHEALGFVLGASLRSDVNRWVEQRSASCEEKRQGSVLRCLNVATESEGKIADLHFQFDAEQRLVAVDLFWDAGSGERGLARYEAATALLHSRVGPSTGHSGTPSARYLEAGYLRRVASEFNYERYVAKVSATNFGSVGVRVREQYQWIPESRVD